MRRDGTSRCNHISGPSWLSKMKKCRTRCICLQAVVHGHACRTSQQHQNSDRRYFEVFETGTIAHTFSSANVCTSSRSLQEDTGPQHLLGKLLPFMHYQATRPDIIKAAKKDTTILTSKRIVAETMNKLCPGDHEHCRLEGYMKGFGAHRTSFMEDYQPAFCSTLATALASFEKPHNYGRMPSLSANTLNLLARSLIYMPLASRMHFELYKSFTATGDTLQLRLWWTCYTPVEPQPMCSPWLRTISAVHAFATRNPASRHWLQCSEGRPLQSVHPGRCLLDPRREEEMAHPCYPGQCHQIPGSLSGEF